MSNKLGTFDHVIQDSSKKFGDRVVYSRFNSFSSSWDTVSFFELNLRVRDLAKSFAYSGIKEGDKVAILSEASIDWIETFYALMLLNAVVVPLDVKISKNELANIVEHADCRFIFASEQFLEHARDIRHGSLSSLKLFTLGKKWMTLNHEFQINEKSDALAIICYTSGTLGAPKGVMITKRALLTQMEDLAEIEKSNHEVSFSILPLNHIYGLTAGPLTTLKCGFELCFPHQLSPDAFKKCLADRKVTIFITVPLYLRMVMNEIFNKVKTAGALKFTIFKLLLNIMQYVPVKGIKKRLFKDIHAYFENNLKKFICGGAPLSISVDKFYKAIGLDVFEGYGLTETAPVIAFNYEKNRLSGSVGKPLKQVEVKISEDGEILTKSACVFVGYWKNESLTNESFTEDGWFKTGDFGVLKNGFLKVTGRKKSLIVLPSGKKVHPEEVEAFLSNSALVRFICVLGVHEKVVAVIQPTDDLINKFKGKETELKNMVIEEIRKISTSLSEYKRPHEVIVMTEGIPMTPSFKVKREVLKGMLQSEMKISRARKSPPLAIGEQINV